MPVGNARASVDKRLHRAAMQRIAQVLQRGARANQRRQTGRRRPNSRSAGFRNNSGFSAASLPSSMKSRYICAGEMPFASAAATKLPDDTPT